MSHHIKKVNNQAVIVSSSIHVLANHSSIKIFINHCPANRCMIDLPTFMPGVCAWLKKMNIMKTRKADNNAQ